MANTTKKSATKNVATKKVDVKKVDTKKSEVKAIETKKVETKPVEKVNATKINITMDEIEKMFTEAGITFKHNNCNYRIIQGGSSLNVHSRKFAFYMTDADFEKVKGLKANDIECKERDNAKDKDRPNSVFFTTVDTLKMVIGAIAPKKLATA